MVQKIVNIGIADKGNGDPLRVAFDKINQNFTELYGALGLTDSLLNLGSFEFNGNSINTVDSSQIILDQSVKVTSNLTVEGNIFLNGQPIEEIVADYDGGAASTVYDINNTLDGGGAQ